MRPAQLIGSRAQGTLQIAEGAINDLLQLAAGQSQAPLIALRPHNTVLVRYGLLHAHAELPAALEPGESPRITLTLASLVVAWSLRAALRQPFLRFHGRQLTIELAKIPALGGWRDLWKYLHQLTFDTAPGTLRVGFVLAIGGQDVGPAENNARMA
jgi:hypothetical protein